MAGEGSPAIVLVTGYGVDMDESWDKIYDELAATTTVVAYNRLNYGKSSASPDGQPQTARAIVASLRRFLAALPEALSPPYVVAGHSIGGMYAQYWARNHPEEVAGVVFLDSSHPDQNKRGLGDQGCLEKFFNRLDGNKNPKRSTEIRHIDETGDQINASPPYPESIPLTVISATQQAPLLVRLLILHSNFRQIWQNCQNDLAALSPHSKHIWATKSGHFVMEDEPELVIQAIREMIAEIRDREGGDKK